MSDEGGEDRIAAALAEQAAAHARLTDTLTALRGRAAPGAVANSLMTSVRARIADGAATGARLAADRPIAVVGFVLLLGTSLTAIRRLRRRSTETEIGTRELTDRNGAPRRRRSKQGASR